MAIHLNPFRLYKGRLCLNHGLLVEILRCTFTFWEAYKKLIDINGKRHKDVEDLRKVLDRMGFKKKHAKEKDLLKLRHEVVDDFSQGFAHIDRMFKSLDRIIKDDETFLYRAVRELRQIYLRFRSMKNPAIPDYMSYTIQHRIYSLIRHMAETQHHAWVVSKAHSREFVKIEELTIISTRGERRRIRRQTIELDHFRNRIEPLKESIRKLKKVRTDLEIRKLHNEIDELLLLYHKEISNLAHMLHESDVLIRRTEKLFRALEHEAKPLGLRELDRNIRNYSKKLRKLLLRIEKHARRECMEINQIVARLPEPKVEHKIAEVIHLEKEHKREETEEQHEKLAKAA